ncbi:MAG: molybdopterin-dependent oxidoreductase [Burkholderiales bacterium]|nr:molybdopterin-dependent oxidoreductase [Burkholderiales bacterium]
MDLSILNRRSFLKASAMTGAAVALTELPSGLVQAAPAQAATAQAPEDETKIVKTLCKACIHNCAVLAHVRNGRIVKIEGNPESPINKGAVCAKGLSGIQAVYHPNRNKYPLIRVGERGDNKWKRISWKEAIDTIAKKVCDVTNKYGAEYVLVSTGGGGNPHFLSVRRAANALGTPNFFEPGCAQCYLPRTLANHMQYGGGPASTPSIADLACLEMYKKDSPITQMVLWGTDPCFSNPAAGGLGMAELRAKGIKTVSIDPRFIPDAAKADVWLPIRPGTDVPLMLAWVKYIIDNDLYDHDFVMKWTNCPYLVDTDTKFALKAKDVFGEGGEYDRVVWDKKTNSMKPLPYPWDDNLDVELDGEHVVNGKTYKTAFRLLRERAEPWTLEAAGKECWLDPKQIEKAIQIYCSGPGGISLGVATDQNPNSVEAAMGSVILNALRGNIECPGALIQNLPVSINLEVGCVIGSAPKLLPKGQLKKKLGGKEHKGLYQWDASSPPAVLEAMRTGNPYMPKVWLERSGNKFGVVADATAWEQGAKNMELIVHMYMYPTSFSQFADILLPAREWLETDLPIEHLNMVFGRQAVVHLWETEDETLWWSKLAKRCAELGHKNCQRACDPNFMGDDLAYWDSMEELLDKKFEPFGMTWKEFLEKQPIEFLPYDKWNTYYVYKEIDPKTGKPKGFGTPSKKIEVYCDGYITLARTGKPYALDDDVEPASIDYDPLPFYSVPAENPFNDVGKEYPLVITSGRLPMYHHGTLRNIPYLREIYPAPEIWVNPVDCEKYGVKNGDWVWVESKRGKIRAICRNTTGVQPGITYLERFWFPEKMLDKETHGYKECNINVLTKRTPPQNGPVGTYTLRGFQVKISKAPGAPEGIWLKPEDFKPWLPQPTDNTPNPEL